MKVLVFKNSSFFLAVCVVDINAEAQDGTTATELLMYAPSDDPFIPSFNPTSMSDMVELLPKNEKGLYPGAFFWQGI